MTTKNAVPTHAEIEAALPRMTRTERYLRSITPPDRQWPLDTAQKPVKRLDAELRRVERTVLRKKTKKS
jgi:hypothetical protein